MRSTTKKVINLIFTLLFWNLSCTADSTVYQFQMFLSLLDIYESFPKNVNGNSSLEFKRKLYNWGWHLFLFNSIFLTKSVMKSSFIERQNIDFQAELFSLLCHKTGDICRSRYLYKTLGRHYYHYKKDQRRSNGIL